MAIRLTNAEINQLLSEMKPLPLDYRERLQVKPKHGHKESEMAITGGAHSDFRVILRQSEFNPLDFSVILAYRPPGKHQLFRLRRYNGKSHEHTNKLEGESFYDFHVHQATERYQEAGFREDSFAQPSDRFADLYSAVKCMLQDCSFIVPNEAQGILFE